MIANKERTGAFTSSKAYLLMASGKGQNGFSAGALTYIEERRIERNLGRSCGTDNPNKAMLWGHFNELRVYELIGGKEFSEYSLVSNESIIHPDYNFWSGSPDLMAQNKVGDIKCYAPKNFALLTDAILLKDIPNFRKTHPEEYWQLVSNAAICKVGLAESISYMPHEKELIELKEMADYMEGDDQWKYKFISDAVDYNKESLSFLPDEGFYKSLNRFEFKVPTEDIEKLTEKILLAESMIQ
jgi:hypothetical protein